MGNSMPPTDRSYGMLMLASGVSPGGASNRLPGGGSQVDYEGPPAKWGSWDSCEARPDECSRGIIPDLGRDPEYSVTGVRKTQVILITD